MVDTNKYNNVSGAYPGLVDEEAIREHLSRILRLAVHLFHVPAGFVLSNSPHEVRVENCIGISSQDVERASALRQYLRLLDRPEIIQDVEGKLPSDSPFRFCAAVPFRSPLLAEPAVLCVLGPEPRISQADAGDLLNDLSGLLISIPYENGRYHADSGSGTRNSVRYNKSSMQKLDRDIPARTSDKEQLRLNEEHYRFLAENISDVIMRHAPDGRCRYVSPTCRYQSGFEPDELIGKAVFEIVHPDDLPKVYDALTQLQHDGEVVQIFRIKRKSGGYLWVESTARIIIDSDTGQPLEIITVTRNISKRIEALQRLELSEELTSSILAASFDAIIALESKRGPNGQLEDFRTLLINPAARRLFGIPESENPLFKSIPGVMNSSLFDRCKAVVETGVSYQDELLFEGESCSGWFHVTVVPRSDGLAVTLRDVNERRKYEKELLESEERFRFALDAARMGTWEWTVHEPVVHVSPTTAVLIGLSPEQNVYSHETLLGTLCTEDVERVQRETRQGFDRGEDIDLEFRIPREGGGVRWLRTRGRVHLDGKGNPTRIGGVIMESTEQKEAEEALRSSEIRYRTLLEQASDAIFITDPLTRKLLDANHRASELVGYSLDELRNMYLDELHPKETRVKYQRHFKQQAERKRTFLPDQYVLHRNGTQIPVDISSSLIEIEGRRLTLSIFRDATERRRSEDQMRQALQKERELGELKSRFISMASHELRTPLSVILSSAELLEQFGTRWDKDMVDKHIRRIRTNVNHVIELLEDVLLLGRADAGKLAFHPECTDITKFTEELIEEIHTDSPVGYDFQVHYSPIPVEADVDPYLMRVILNNLLSNACKYSAPGGPVVIDIEAKNQVLVIKIRDEGIGIPESDVPRVFEPFHRASNVGAVRGTGLGLALVARAVALHQGWISIDSTPGEGTEVTVRIPQYQKKQSRMA